MVWPAGFITVTTEALNHKLLIYCYNDPFITQLGFNGF